MSSKFGQDVKNGLSKKPKFLSSRYFYDKRGDKLFVEIMNMPEYYLTRAEHEIFKTQLNQIVDSLGVKKGQYFEILELGAGDGTKTKELLSHLLRDAYDFTYSPVDISENALQDLKSNLIRDFPDLKVNTKQGDYFGVLNSTQKSDHPKIVLFLGSNLGNLMDKEAHEFLAKLSNNLSSGDKLLLGLDLIKSEDIVLPAYNDKQGITAEFNLNLLHRINKELEADFSLDQWSHEPTYTEDEGIARSFLVSNNEHTVSVLGEKFSFEKGEKIHTEISRKYNDEILANILKDTDFIIIDKLTDSKGYFADYILTKN